jgi:hypothetical protein
MGTHTRHWESEDPQRLAQLVSDARRAANSADGLVRIVLGHLAKAVAAGEDATVLREVATLATDANLAAAKAIDAARSAHDAAQHGDNDRAESMAAEAQHQAVQVRLDADRGMELIPSVRPTA